MRARRRAEARWGGVRKSELATSGLGVLKALRRLPAEVVGRVVRAAVVAELNLGRFALHETRHAELLAGAPLEAAAVVRGRHRQRAVLSALAVKGQRRPGKGAEEKNANTHTT